jgi:hypothetical protein
MLSPSCALKIVVKDVSDTPYIFQISTMPDVVFSPLRKAYHTTVKHYEGKKLRAGMIGQKKIPCVHLTN